MFLFFLFFCLPYLGLWNSKSVFLILKSGNRTDQGSEFSIFQGIHVRFDIRINQIWQADTFTGSDPNETNRAGTCDVITLTSRDKIKALNLHYKSDYGHQTWQDGLLFIKSHDILITWFCEVM